MWLPVKHVKVKLKNITAFHFFPPSITVFSYSTLWSQFRYVSSSLSHTMPILVLRDQTDQFISFTKANKKIATFVTWIRVVQKKYIFIKLNHVLPQKNVFWRVYSELPDSFYAHFFFFYKEAPQRAPVVCLVLSPDWATKYSCEWVYTRRLFTCYNKHLHFQKAFMLSQREDCHSLHSPAKVNNYTKFFLIVI